MPSNLITPSFDIKKRKFFVLRYNNNWQGPYDTKADAQREAAVMATQEVGWYPYYIVQLVGAVTKPVPDMTYHNIED